MPNKTLVTSGNELSESIFIFMSAADPTELLLLLRDSAGGSRSLELEGIPLGEAEAEAEGEGDVCGGSILGRGLLSTSFLCLCCRCRDHISHMTSIETGAFPSHIYIEKEIYIDIYIRYTLLYDNIQQKTAKQANKYISQSKPTQGAHAARSGSRTCTGCTSQVSGSSPGGP
jgi:hypothetical protein